MEKRILAVCLAALIAALGALGVVEGLSTALLLCGCLISAEGTIACLFFLSRNNRKGTAFAAVLTLIGIGVSMLALL